MVNKCLDIKGWVNSVDFIPFIEIIDIAFANFERIISLQFKSIAHYIYNNVQDDSILF